MSVSDWGSVIAPITTMLSGLGGYWLAGRNDEARDKRAGAREIDARRAGLTERLEDQQHDIQRETLLELQDELQKLARATAQILMFDRGNPGGRAAGTVTLPEELDTGFTDNTRDVNRLKTRILDRQLREAIDAFTFICARDGAVPRSGQHLSRDDLISAANQQLTESNDRYTKLIDQLGERLREEIDRLGTGGARLANQAISEFITGKRRHPRQPG